jgi:hypothetical protein
VDWVKPNSATLQYKTSENFADANNDNCSIGKWSNGIVRWLQVMDLSG